MELKSCYEKRIESVRKAVSEKDLDALLVLNGDNRFYLSGFTGEDNSFDESAGALFITPDHLVLATDSRFTIQAEKEASFFDVRTYREGLAKLLPEIVKETGTKRLGFEEIRMSVHQKRKINEELESAGEDCELIPQTQIVENLRLIKEEWEIERMRRALFLAENVFLSFRKRITPGMTEKEAAWQMEKGMREAGAQALSFPTIVASGKNSALPHAIPEDRPFKEGEPILFDWGAKLDGYCSDISRTIVLGQSGEDFKKVFTTVREAQQKAIAHIKDGISSKEVDAIARKHIEEMGYVGKFSHGLGHGVGLAVHEGPRLSPIRDDTLYTGMVCTVEPGIYIKEWGGVRLENMVVVREDSAEVLNSIEV